MLEPRLVSAIFVQPSNASGVKVAADTVAATVTEASREVSSASADAGRVNDEIAATLDSGQAVWMHAYTYSAHPVGCAVALANIDDPAALTVDRSLNLMNLASLIDDAKCRCTGSRIRPAT